MDEDTKNPKSTELDGQRDPKTGYFLKGNKSGMGGSRKPSAEVLELLWDATPKAARRVIEALDAMKTVVVHGARGEPSEHIEVDDWDTRLKAVNILWDRRYGKPVQPIANDEEQPFELKVGSELVDAVRRLADDGK